MTIVVFPQGTSYVPTEELEYSFSKTGVFGGKLCPHRSCTQGRFYNLFLVWQLKFCTTMTYASHTRKQLWSSPSSHEKKIPTMPRVQLGKVDSYHRATRPLMSFVHAGREYQPSHVWTRDELLAVTPDIIVRYIKLKVYGSEDAQADVTPPLYYRSSTIKFWKKAWSYFMLNQMTPWNKIAGMGNPTRSIAVNKIIKAMKKMESARLGRPSNARQAFRSMEYEQVIEILGAQTGEPGIWLAAYLEFQLSMIARIDDTAKFRAPDLQPLEDFPFFGVTARLCWSKNCYKERDAPTQILFGAEDWRYCVLSLLASWLELHFLLNPEPNEYFFGAFGMTDPITIKNSAGYYLRKIIKDEDFIRAVIGQLGSHSNRKFGVTYARKSGCSKDDTNFRGRWKNHRRQQDEYADTTIPYVDAKVAGALCKGGLVAYVLMDASGITNQWVLDYVAPGMRSATFCADPQSAPNEFTAVIPEQVCIILGRALLWKVFHPSGEHGVAPEIKARILHAYTDLGGRNTLGQGENPVKKIPLGVTGVDSELVIDELLQESEAGRNGDIRVCTGMERQEVCLLLSQVLHLRRELRDAAAKQDCRFMLLCHELSRIKKNVARVAIMPARREQVLGESTGGQ